MVDEILDYGIYVFGNEQSFFDWLMTPNKSLSGIIPYDIMKTEDCYKIMDVLGRIEHGIYS